MAAARTMTSPKVFILASILSLSCFQLAQSFSSSTTNNGKNVNKSKTQTVESNLNNRIFVAGISPTCDEQTIQTTFSKFGAIDDIAIIGQKDDKKSKRNRSPYCFVTFDDESSAQRALLEPSVDGVYKEVQLAMPIDSRRKSNESRSKEEERLIHLDRLVDYLNA